MVNIDRIFLRFDGGKGQVCISRGSAREMRTVLSQAAIHLRDETELASELLNMVEQLKNAEETWKKREDY